MHVKYLVKYNKSSLKFSENKKVWQICNYVSYISYFIGF